MQATLRFNGSADGPDWQPDHVADLMMADADAELSRLYAALDDDEDGPEDGDDDYPLWS